MPPWCLYGSRLADNQIVVGKDKGFTFDAAYSSMASQEQIFEEMVVPLVESMLQGYNATLFAYGQTGSGKTHTMVRPSSRLRPPQLFRSRPFSGSSRCS